MFKEVYTTENLKIEDKTGQEAQKRVISEDAYAICEVIERFVEVQALSRR